MTNATTSANITPIMHTEQKINSIAFKDKGHEKFITCIYQSAGCIPQGIDILSWNQRENKK